MNFEQLSDEELERLFARLETVIQQIIETSFPRFWIHESYPVFSIHNGQLDVQVNISYSALAPAEEANHKFEECKTRIDQAVQQELQRTPQLQKVSEQNQDHSSND